MCHPSSFCFADLYVSYLSLTFFPLSITSPLLCLKDTLWQLTNPCLLLPTQAHSHHAVSLFGIVASNLIFCLLLPIAPMPLERCNAVLDLSNATIVLGPRKHHPTEHVLENGDPLASKKKRRDNVSTGNAGVTASNITNPCADNGKDMAHTLSLIPPLPSQLAHTLPCATQRDAMNHAQHNDTDTANAKYFHSYHTWVVIISPFLVSTHYSCLYLKC
jgi:hypothetical protein